MPCGARRRRRSNAVGSSSPMSTPRCTSRHCTAPGKRLHRPRGGPQRRRRPTDRDLRHPGRRADQRQARVAHAAASGIRPPLERRPSGPVLGRDRPGADLAAHTRDRRLNDRPQRERQRDRRVAVVPSLRHAPRHHREHCAAAHASVAPTDDDDPARGAPHLAGAAELSIAVAMAVQSERTARWPTGRPAVDARAGPGRLDGGRRGKPPLDVERVMNDS